MHRFIAAILLLAAPHRTFASTGELPGALFAEPDFFILGPGIGMGLTDDTGTLGDVDGDGDVDLVTVWTRWSPHVYAGDGAPGEHFPHWGWTVASNDGLGGLVPTRDVMRAKRESGESVPLLSLWGDDFDGDGRLDLAFEEGLDLELWHNRGEDGFATILQLPNVGFIGLADGEGDGDVDLLVMEYDEAALHNHEGTSQATLWFNEGAAEFVRSDRFTLDSEERLFPRLWPTEPLLGEGGALRLLWTRTCYQQLQGAQPPGAWLTQPWTASAEPPRFFKSMVNPCYASPLQIDRDGQMDLVSIAEVNMHIYHGLALWRLDAAGAVRSHALLGSQVHVQGRPLVSDLNGDSLLDVALVDSNLETGPALVVLVGQRDGVPVLEGRYRLPGTGNEVLDGDLNGDGAADLVVLGRNEAGGPGGAFVFINQSSPPTAVAVEAATPSDFVLGANYPNPFNPATTIPLSVLDGSATVDVAIYNFLGQLVRQVWSGPLAAGEHRLTWDGRDRQGRIVSSGAYLYQLRVGDQVRTRKMVKLE